jgi:hypothetical protein
MLALITDSIRSKAIQVALLVCFGSALVSCATKEPGPLIADPSASNRETALPWNEQKKWEREGQMAGLTEQRR